MKQTNTQDYIDKEIKDKGEKKMILNKTLVG